MQDTFTLSLSGNSSVLEATYFPRIELSEDRQYSLGLASFLTFNTIPNITAGNNKIHFTDGLSIAIPTGSYEIDDIALYLKPHNIELFGNTNTLHSHIQSTRELDFTTADSVGQLLGFTPRILDANVEHISDIPINILKVNSIRIECNITTGAFINGKKVHTIHEFFPAVPPGYKIIEVPSNIIYLPVSVNTIDHIQLRIVDQVGDLVDFRGETITVRLHLKSH